MAGLFGAVYDNTQNQMQELSDMASTYSEGKTSDDGIMSIPPNEKVDAGSWWAWLNGLTRQKTKENIERVQEELKGMQLSTIPPDFQDSIQDAVSKMTMYQDTADFIIPEQSDVTVEPLDATTEPMTELPRLMVPPESEDSPAPSPISVEEPPVADQDTGQPIQSAADVDSKQGLMSSPRPKPKPEGLGEDVGGFNELNFKLNKSMNPAITMDKVYQNIGTKPGQVNPKAQENLDKMLTNQFTTLMKNVDFDIVINDAIVKPGSTRIPNPDKNKKGTPGSRHFHGDALDISIAGLNTKQLDKLLVESYKAGFRGFGFGNNILHIDLNAGKNSVRAWDYGNDYWANNKEYPVDDVINRVRKGIE